MKVENYRELNKQAYDALWCDYKKRAINKGKFEEKPEILGGMVLRLAKDSFSKIKVLEIGPGSGEILRYFCNSGCQTIAVEISRKIAQMVKQYSPSSEIIIEDVLDVSFPSFEFEIVYAGALIHLFTLEDSRLILKKFYKWLKPKGYLFVNTTIHECSLEGFFPKKDYRGEVIRYRRYWTEKEFYCEIEKAKFLIKQRLFTDEKDRNKKWVGLIAQKL